jgi:hypothetical protein
MQFHDGVPPSERPAADGSRTADLRAQAMLDALGMLDEVDAAQFDRAFREAPASVQAELRALQADVVADPAFLSDSDESPAADLKVRTLARVMTEVERQDADYAPIAHIGRTATRPGRRSVGSIDANDLVQQAMDLAVARADVDRFASSSRVWRAAAFALMAALVAALVFQVRTQSVATMIAEYALGNASPRQIFDTLDHPGAQERLARAAFVRGLSSAEGRSGGTLTVAVDEQDGKVLALGIGLEANREYRLCVRSSSGDLAVVGTFTARQATWAAEFPLGPAMVRDLRSGSVELLDADGEVVMRS